MNKFCCQNKKKNYKVAICSDKLHVDFFWNTTLPNKNDLGDWRNGHLN